MKLEDGCFLEWEALHQLSLAARWCNALPARGYPGAPYFIKGGVILVDAGCIEKQNNCTEFINTRRLISTAKLLLDKSVVINWANIDYDLCPYIIDYVAVLAILVTGYDEAKSQILKDETFRLKTEPDDSEDDKFLIGLFKIMVLNPEFYLTVVHREFGELPMAELKVIAKTIQEKIKSYVALDGRGYDGTASAES